MTKYKRNKIMEKYHAMNAKNEEKKNRLFAIQNQAISKSLIKQQASMDVCKLLLKLKKINPFNINERQQLIKAIKDIKVKYDLKINIPDNDIIETKSEN